MSPFIVDNVRSIQERIASAAIRSGRQPQEITLVAVAKTFGPEAILQAYQAGIRDIGENRVEEGQAKIPLVFARLPPGDPIRWHMIGHIQRRKARDVTLLFDLVQSVDSLRLAQALNRVAARPLPALLEINIANEPQKFGLPPEPFEEVCAQVAQILALKSVQVQGLMAVGPQVERPADSAPFFRRLRELRERLRKAFPSAQWDQLSMGMTADFEIAIAEGATLVRVGRAIFGERMHL